MAKQTVTFSLDVEASGPVPGPWWMCSFGICRTDDVERGLRCELQPLIVPGLSKPETPAAMEVVCRGLPELAWDRTLEPSENVARVRRHFVDRGLEPASALEELRAWLAEEAGGDRAVLVGSPVTFDFMWIYWYWWYLRDEMPPFGYSGLDIRSYFMGSHGVGFLGTGKRRYLKHYPNDLRHTHDPLDDARQQGRIWNDMTRARRERDPG